MDYVPTGIDVAKFLGRGSDLEFRNLCDTHMPVVVQFARAYTRNQGFDSEAEECEPDLRAVLIAACARLSVNPAQQDREGADGWFAQGSFQGWTLAERFCLDGYRRKTA